MMNPAGYLGGHIQTHKKSFIEISCWNRKEVRFDCNQEVRLFSMF